MPEAEAAVGEALKAEPNNVEALVFRARLSLSLMHADAAERDVTAGLLVVGDNPYLRATRAEMLLERDKPELALRNAAAASALVPDDADILWIKARVEMALDRLDDAERHLDRALVLEPYEFRVQLFKAHVQLRRGAFEGAIATADKILTSRPGDVSALEVRAVANEGRGREQDAVDDLTEIVGKPGEPLAGRPALTNFNQLLVQRAVLLVRLRRLEEASRDLETAIALGGQKALLRMQLYLRKNGFSDLPLDGQRTIQMNEALKVCFINPSCGRGIVRTL